MDEPIDRTTKKSKKKHSTSKREAEASSKDRSVLPNERFLSEDKIKNLSSKQRLWLFAFPEALNITSLSKQEIDIPDQPAPNSVVARITIDGIDYEVFENSDAENIVNIVPKSGSNSHVPGQPFQRYFTIRKAFVIPTVDHAAIRKQEKVVQVVEAARIQSEEIARTQPLCTKDCPPQPKKRRLEEQQVVEAVKKTKKHKKNHLSENKKDEHDDAKKTKQRKSKEKKKERLQSQEAEKKRKKSK